MSKPSLLARLRTAIRRRNYSYRTEQAYANWVVRYIKSHDVRHPSEMAERREAVVDNTSKAPARQGEAFEIIAVKICEDSAEGGLILRPAAVYAVVRGFVGTQ